MNDAHCGSTWRSGKRASRTSTMSPTFRARSPTFRARSRWMPIKMCNASSICRVAGSAAGCVCCRGCKRLRLQPRRDRRWRVPAIIIYSGRAAAAASAHRLSVHAACYYNILAGPLMLRRHIGWLHLAFPSCSLGFSPRLLVGLLHGMHISHVLEQPTFGSSQKGV